MVLQPILLQIEGQSKIIKKAEARLAAEAQAIAVAEGCRKINESTIDFYFVPAEAAATAEAEETAAAVEVDVAETTQAKVVDTSNEASHATEVPKKSFKAGHVDGRHSDKPIATLLSDQEEGPRIEVANIE
jgi:hypothetical protein